MNRIYDVTVFREEERPIDTLSARRQVPGVRRTSVRFINIVIGAQKSVCHTQESYVFPFPQQPLPPAKGEISFSFIPLLGLFSNAVLPPPSPPPPLLYIGRPTFLSLFLMVFLTRCPAFAAPFLLPSPHPARHTTLRQSLVPLFFALWKSFVPTADVQPFVEDDRTKKGA